MRAVRITFETIKDDGAIEFQRRYEVSAKLLRKSRIRPFLPLEAERLAAEFWQAVVGMGLFDEPLDR